METGHIFLNDVVQCEYIKDAGTNISAWIQAALKWEPKELFKSTIEEDATQNLGLWDGGDLRLLM